MSSLLKRDSTRNMTEGSPMKLLVSFIIPTLFGYLFQQFYNMADSIVVGRFLGSNALAGVGSTSSVTFLVLGLCTGICTGFTVPVAQSFGRRDYAALKRYMGNIIWLTAISAAVITAATALSCGGILHLMGNPKETFDYAYIYLLICFLGIPATMAYNLASSVMRALGDSKTPLYFLFFSSGVNIVLDIVLILYTPLEVAGAALATVISQFLSAILSIIYMAKNFPVLHLEREDMKLLKAEVKELLLSGLPMGLQSSVTGIGAVIMQSSINALGPLYMAAFTAGDKVHVMMISPMDAAGTACAAYAGQNVGANKLERVNKGVRCVTVLGIIYCAVIFIAAFFGGGFLVSLFIDSTETGIDTAEIIRLGHEYLITCVAFFIFLLFIHILRCSIQGMGFSSYAMFGGVLELIGRGAMSIFVVPVVGFFAVGFAAPAAWILADMFFFPMYFICINKLKKKLQNREVKT